MPLLLRLPLYARALRALRRRRARRRIRGVAIRLPIGLGGLAAGALAFLLGRRALRRRGDEEPESALSPAATAPPLSAEPVSQAAAPESS